MADAPPPSYDELFNKPDGGANPSAPPPPPGSYAPPGAPPHSAAGQPPYAPYPAATAPGQYGTPVASQGYGAAPLQPPYPQQAGAGTPYMPSQPHPAYGPSGPVAVPAQPYRDPYAQPGQYTYNTVTATTTGSAGYNTTPLAYGTTSNIGNRNPRKMCLFILCFIVFFVIFFIVVITIVT